MRLSILLLAAALLTGCADGAVRVAAPAAGPSTVAPSPPPPPRVDWATPSTVRLSDRFSLGDCAGDAPLVCVTSGGRVVGALEVLRFPVASLPALAGKAGREALTAHAAAYVASFVEDRRAGCPAGYRVTPAPARFVAPDVVAYGFTGTLASGAPSERQVQYAGIRGADLVVLSAPAYEAEGCLPPEGDGFDVATLDALVPLLDAVMARSPLP